MRSRHVLTVFALMGAATAFAQPQPREATVKVSFGQQYGPLEIDKMALGQEACRTSRCGRAAWRRSGRCGRG